MRNIKKPTLISQGSLDHFLSSSNKNYLDLYKKRLDNYNVNIQK